MMRVDGPRTSSRNAGSRPVAKCSRASRRAAPTGTSSMTQHEGKTYGTAPAHDMDESLKQQQRKANGNANKPQGDDAIGNEFFIDGYVVDYFPNAFGNLFRHVHHWGQ